MHEGPLKGNTPASVPAGSEGPELELEQQRSDAQTAGAKASGRRPSDRSASRTGGRTWPRAIARVAKKRKCLFMISSVGPGQTKNGESPSPPEQCTNRAVLRCGAHRTRRGSGEVAQLSLCSAAGRSRDHEPQRAVHSAARSSTKRASRCTAKIPARVRRNERRVPQCVTLRRRNLPSATIRCGACSVPSSSS
jgi:hypothetical protein